MKNKMYFNIKSLNLFVYLQRLSETRKIFQILIKYQLINIIDIPKTLNIDNTVYNFFCCNHSDFYITKLNILSAFLT